MKIGNMTTTTLFSVSLLGISVPCLASETPLSGNYEQKILQEEAIVVRIFQNNVTLQVVGEKGKTITAPFSNAADFKVGDKVIVNGNTLKKFDAGPNEKSRPQDTSSDAKTTPTANKL